MGLDSNRENSIRIKFVKAFLRVIEPTHRPEVLFEHLNDTFAEVYGMRVFKDYNAFRSSRSFLIRTGKIKAEKIEYVKRPEKDENNMICPGCSTKLIFK